MSNSTSQSAITAGLETAKSLIQRVSRTFYGPRQSIVLDQLIRKEAMRDDELAGRVGMPTRDLSKITQKLLEDQIISIHRRSELKEGAPKAQQRAYYYIDYSHATDVIKWRMYKIQETIDVKLRNELSNQGYVCPTCQKAFTPLDASDLFDPVKNILACDICGSEVDNNENEADVRGNKDRMQRLVEQTRVIRDSLKKMDDVVLPRFDIAKWCDLNGPAGGPATSNDATAEASGSFFVEMAGDDDEAKMKAQKEADADEKRSQNQLPTWIAQSTISGEASTASLQSSSHLTALSLATANSEKVNNSAQISSTGVAKSTLDSDLDTYYANLAAQAAKIELPPSNINSPILQYVKEEEGGSEFDFEEREKLQEIELEKVMKSMPAEINESNSNGKRSRDEVNSGWEEEELNDELDRGGKRMRTGTTTSSGGETPLDTNNNSNNESREETLEVLEENTPSGIVDDGEEEDDDDEFEFEEEGGDPNPLIAIGDKMVPFLEVGEELQTAMTPEEYTLYWDVYQRLG